MKDKWYIFGEYSGLPWLHACYNQGLTEELKKRSGVKIQHFAVYWENGIQRQYAYGDEWSKAGQKYLDIILENPQKLKKDVENITKSSDDLFAFSKKLTDNQFKNLSPEEIFDRFHTFHHEIWCTGMVTNLLELNQSYLSDYLHKYITQNRSIDPDEWICLITPTELSYAQKEDIALHHIALEIKKKSSGNLANAIQSNPKLIEEFGNLYSLYKCVRYGWTGPATTEEYYYDTLEKLIHLDNLDEKYQSLLSHPQNLEDQQQRILDQFKVDSYHRELFTLLRGILFTKTYRMDALFQGYCALESTLNQLSQKYSLTMQEIYMINDPQFYFQLKKNEFDKSILSQATKYSAYLYENGKLNFYVGHTARDKMAPILADVNTTKHEETLKGQIAFPGIVKGPVKIILSSQDNAKIEPGDILVSYATDPSLLPAMEKAAAYLTDMGGLTCHAAIVARELKKPCIVGTKTATKILKDGDIIEIDANQGIATKLEGE